MIMYKQEKICVARIEEKIIENWLREFLRSRF